MVQRAPANRFSYLSSTGPAFIGVGNMLNKSIYDTFLELNNLPYLVPTVSNLAALKEFLANLKSVFLDSQKPPQLLEDSKRTACDVMDRDARFLICRPSYLDVYLLLQQSDDVECAPFRSLAMLHSRATLLCYARSCGSGRREEPYSHRLRPPLHFAVATRRAHERASGAPCTVSRSYRFISLTFFLHESQSHKPYDSLL